jgi:hypothetical protein
MWSYLLFIFKKQAESAKSGGAKGYAKTGKYKNYDIEGAFGQIKML